jgi:hypothetical protein
MLDHDKRQRLHEVWRRRRDSEALLGAVMAGIAMLFIAGIVAAYFYAKDTNEVLTAGHETTPSASAPAPSATAPAETTGSGGASPPARNRETTGSGGGGPALSDQPPKQDPRDNEQIERP